MREGVTDLGMTTLPSWTCQRRTTWAGVRESRCAIPVIDGVLEQLAAGGQRAPGLGDDAVLGVEGAQLALLQVRVQLDLVEGRQLAGLVEQPLQVRGLEVADPGGADAALRSAARAARARCRRSASLRRHRPVDQVEVDDVQAEALGGGVEGAQRGVVACSSFQTLVVRKISSRGTSVRARARPTPSSLLVGRAVSMLR